MSSVQVPLVDLRAQYRTIQTEIDSAISGVLERADFILGADVQAFEEEFASYVGVDHAVALDSGVSALELGMRALGIGPGDEVITPANSFIASSSAISFTGATPVWVDVDERTYNITPETVAPAITERTKAIMPVHLYGQPADLDALLSLAAEHDLKVIEDACQAHGARWRGRRVGAFGDFAAFSFYPGKNLGAYGDAGMLTTTSAEIAERVSMFRNYGQRRKYDHVQLAWNRRMDTLQAAVLRVKLRRLDAWNESRRRVASLYDELLDLPKVTRPFRDPRAEHVYHLYVIEVDDRDAVLSSLTTKGIAAGIHYPVPIHLQEAYRARGIGPGSFPVSEATASSVLSLPIYPEIGDDQVGLVVEALSGALQASPSVTQ